MRIIGVIALLCFLQSPLIAAEEPSEAEMELGNSLVAAIVENDIVAYSHCWMSLRQIDATSKESGRPIPAERRNEMREYIALRNKSVAESFRKIQSLIKTTKTKRKSIRLKSCRAEGVRELKTKKGLLKKAGSLVIVMTVDTEEWHYSIDDGGMANGIWYFGDKPMQLDTGKTELQFEDYLKKTKK